MRQRPKSQHLHVARAAKLRNKLPQNTICSHNVATDIATLRQPLLGAKPLQPAFRSSRTVFRRQLAVQNAMHSADTEPPSARTVPQQTRTAEACVEYRAYVVSMSFEYATYRVERDRPR